MSPEDDKIRERLRRMLAEEAGDPDAASTPETPREPVLARYELRGRLGEGGSAVVYRAWDRELGRSVALKVLRQRPGADDVLQRRFRREAQAAASLSHPNVVAVHDVGEVDGRLYLVMELVEGSSLLALLRERRGGTAWAARILLQVARGVGAAHLKGIIHRDLKPGNILVTPAEQAKVADFGLALVAEGHSILTRTGVTVGTPLYMAPEQVRGDAKQISARTDVHALGAILYEAITGRAPFLGATVAEIYAQILDRAPAPPGRVNAAVPRDLEKIVEKAMDKDPARRYADANGFALDLQRFLEGQPVVAQSRTWWDRMRVGIRRHRLAWGVGASLVAAVAVALAIAVRSDRELRAQSLASQLSAAYFDLVLQSGAAMQGLEDWWHGAREGVDADARLGEIEGVARRCSEKYPQTALPRAWKALARHYAGRPDGLAELETCARASTEDPFPCVLLARARMAAYVDEADLEWPWDADQPQPTARFRENARMAEARKGAEEALARALSMAVWPRLSHGQEYLAYLDGAARLAAQDYKAAIARLGAVREDPLLRAEVEMMRGFAFYVTGRPGEACEASEIAAARGWTKALLLAGLSRAASGYCSEEPLPRMRQAAQHLDRLIRTAPHIASGHLHRGLVELWMVRAGAGDASAAVACFTEALARDPQCESAHFYRAQAHLLTATLDARRGRWNPDAFDRALADCDAALRINPANAMNRWGRGLAFLQRAQARGDRPREALPDLDAAIAELSEAIRLAPRFRQAYGGRGSALVAKARHQAALGEDAEKCFAEAVADCDRRAELDPDDWAPWFDRGLSGRDWARWKTAVGRDASATLDRALADFTEVIRRNAGYAPAWSERGMAHFLRGLAAKADGLSGSGSFEHAVADLDEALRRNPDDAGAKQNRAAALKELGR